MARGIPGERHEAKGAVGLDNAADGGGPSSSSDAQQNIHRPSSKDTSLAHQAALRRLNIRSSPTTTTAAASSSSEPVLVSAGPQPPRKMPTARQQKEKTTATTTTTSTNNKSACAGTRDDINYNETLPSPSDFTFDAILASIGPDATAAIDAIAEICGRSKMSLADEHESHLPPQGAAAAAASSPSQAEVESLPIARLETLSEGVQTRAMAKRRRQAGLGERTRGNATRGVSRFSVVGKGAPSVRPGKPGKAETGPGAVMPAVMAWLRGKGVGGTADDAGEGSMGRDEAGAAGTLHRLLLGDAERVRG